MSPDGGWLIAILRALTDASLLSMLGALVFRAVVAPAGLSIARCSAAVACLALSSWIAAEAINLGGSVAATPEILSLTESGHLAAASVGCAVIVLIVAGQGWRPGVALVAAIAAVRASLPGLIRAVRRYSVLGIGGVLVLLVTAPAQGSILVGSLAGWVGTACGNVAIVKAGLFAILIGLALVNRQVLSPALAGACPGLTRRRLAGSIAVETAVGLMVVSAAALLSSLEPAMHHYPLWSSSPSP